ncbi:MAG: hypothetical protein RIE08_18260 [Acidimicrobiales bacterium]
MDTLRSIADDHTALAERLRSEGVKWAFGAWSDIAGRPKGKVVPIDNLPGMLAGSERYTPRGMGNLGEMNPNEEESVGIPDPASVRILPWDPTVAFFAANLVFAGKEPFSNCPRSILQSVLDRLEADGRRFMLGVEVEFHIFQRDKLPELVPLAASNLLYPTPAYDIESTMDSMPVLTEIAEHMQAADLGLFSFDQEGGSGQYELDFTHAEVTDMCDRLMFLRLLLRHVAKNHDAVVSFMPKPSHDSWGSGAHMNMSLEDIETGENLFIEGTGEDRCWTPMAMSFAAGLLRHANALAALTCPTVNSYKRLVPRLSDGSVSWAPVWAEYGTNNRSCMLRLPGNRPAIENRTVDTSANMYIASAFSLAAGLEGIALGLDPGEAVKDNASWRDESSGPKGRRIPRNLLEAIEAFEDDPLVHETFPAPFVRDYIAMRRGEWNEYHEKVSPWEFDRYFENT